MKAAATLTSLLALGAAGCGDGGSAAAVDAGDAEQEACEPAAGDAVSFDPEAEPCRELSAYRFFKDGAAQEPSDRVVPFSLNTPLFSDYATKHRFIWLPEGASITYREGAPLEFPVGAVIIKTFSYLTDLRDAAAGERLVETRLLVHREDGWDGEVYVWNDEQTEATLQVAGGVVPVSWTHTDGSERELQYIVPSIDKCKNCHVDKDDEMAPIGPQARHLNREFDYADGAANQLTKLAEVGYLEGAPNPSSAPRAPVLDDPDTGTVAERARAWLDINCAHCHSPDGPARTSGLDLSITQDNPIEFGVCKTPVAAGAGSGGLQYNIVPGAPDDSILVFRLESTEPDIRMPELLRQTVHAESVAVIREWIAAMDGTCGTAHQRGDSI